MRWHSRSTAVALAVLVVAGCGASTPAQNTPSDTLQVVGQFEVHGLDPATAGGLFTRLQATETLVDAGVDGVLRPGLAQDWRASKDARSWSFRLRPDAVFHDGTPVTAEHVVAALEQARRSEGTPLATVPWAAVRVDQDAVRVDLTEPFGSLPAVLAHTSAQVLAPGSYAPDGTVTAVIGSGPYKVERVEQPAAVDLVAAEQWRGEQPAVRRVRYQSVGRAEARALMAESGQADITFGMDPASLGRLTDDAALTVEGVTVPRTIMLKVNAGHPVFGDVRVRRAISLALDRTAMATALLRDPELAATQLFPPSLPQWHSEAVAPLQRDPQAARALLEQAGWAPGPDGVRSRAGARLQLTLRTYPDRAELPVIASAVQAALAEVGVAVDVQVGNSSEIPAGHEDGSLELGLYARNFSLVPDPLVTLLGDFDADGAEYGAMGWNSPVVTQRLTDLADGGDGADGSAGAAAREQVAQVLQDQLPVIPVAWYRQSAVVNQRVEGVELDPLERSYRLTDVRWAG